MESMDTHDATPSPKRRALALGLLFAAFTSLVSAVIWWQTDELEVIHYLIILGAPVGFGTVAYLIGLYVSDDAYGA